MNSNTCLFKVFPVSRMGTPTSSMKYFLVIVLMIFAAGSKEKVNRHSKSKSGIITVNILPSKNELYAHVGSVKPHTTLSPKPSNSVIIQTKSKNSKRKNAEPNEKEFRKRRKLCPSQQLLEEFFIDSDSEEHESILYYLAQLDSVSAQKIPT